QTTKSGHLYLFERSNGKPIYPIEYRSYPPSDVPGEVAAKTQPFPTKPAPFSRQIMAEELLTRRTPEVHRWAQEKFRTFHGGNPFIPFRVDQETILFPGFDGGAEWGGPAFDPESGLFYVNANEMVWTSSLARNQTARTGRQLYLQHCANCHSDKLAGAPPQYPSLLKMGPKWDLAAVAKITREGAGRMPGFPILSPADVQAVSEYVLSGESKPIQPDEPAVVALDYRFTGYHKFLDPEGYPAVAPPWGTLNAINLNTGEYAWKIPLGEYPELAAKGLTNTGSENYGGPVVTAGGLLFLGATNYDRKFRAFDKSTGKLLWETTLPFSANAAPAVYSVGGRQFVAICAEGAKGRATDPKGSRLIAFALPQLGGLPQIFPEPTSSGTAGRGEIGAVVAQSKQSGEVPLNTCRNRQRISMSSWKTIIQMLNKPVAAARLPIISITSEDRPDSVSRARLCSATAQACFRWDQRCSATSRPFSSVWGRRRSSRPTSANVASAIAC
ncbi:MAG: c-type cytochrome, partial [Armatimonadetes bacterium]|nr:c-type cytochrome [Armatimonadota bacterium]